MIKRALLFCMAFLLSLGISIAQQNVVDSLEGLLKTAKTNDARLALLDDLSQGYLDLDPEKALELAKQQTEIAATSGSKVDRFLAKRNVADATAATGDDSTAIELYLQALELSLPDTSEHLKGHLHRQLGNAHYHLAEYDLALESFLAALEHWSEERFAKDRAGVLNNIGNVFYFTNISEAAKYYEQSLEIHKRLGNEDGVASQLGNLGLVFINTKQFEKAITYSEQSLDIYTKLGWERSIARQQVNLAYAYKEIGKSALALKYAKASLLSREKLNDVRGIATSTIMLGNIYFSLEDFGEAIRYYEPGLEMTRELGMRSYEWETMAYLAQCYAKQGLKEKALEIYPKVIDIKDSIYKQESQATIAELETKYETEQKENKIRLLTTEAELAELQLRKRENYLLTAVIVTFLLGIISLILFFFYRTRTKANLALEKKNMEISEQKSIIEEKNLHITDSIRYAERLQAAILPKGEMFAKHFTDHYILYRPKDIVSGDFYWMEEANGLIFLAAADCTGHGVPGAMVSMVGFQGLNKAVLEEKLTSPAAILQRLSDHVEEAFEKSGGSVKDGMDICLVAIDTKKRTVTYAGAHNALWILSSKDELPNANLREEEKGMRMFELKADRRSIGGFMDAGSFSESTVSLNEGDRLFLFSDGFADQFGGPQGKKMGSKRMRETVREMALSGNLLALGAIFEDWKGTEEQIDDVTLISVVV